VPGAAGLIRAVPRGLGMEIGRRGKEFELHLSMQGDA